MALETLVTGFTSLEAPRVDDQGRLWFSDLSGGIYRRSPGGTIDRFLPDRKWVGGLALNEDGAVIVAGPGGITYFNPDTGETRPLLTEFDGQPILGVNDIHPDGKGGLYGGLIDMGSMVEQRPPTQGNLFRFDASGKVTLLWDGVPGSNGIGLSPNGTHLYHAATSQGVFAHEMAADGSVKNRTLLAPMADCDGLAVDAEGGVWVAGYDAGAVVRYTPDGKIERKVELPVKMALSLTFAGDDLRDLYIVTGSDFFDPTARTGAAYRTRSDIPGQKTAKTRF